MTNDDIDAIIDGIENFIIEGFDELIPVWQPYIDKLKTLKIPAGAKNYNTRETLLHRRAQQAESDVARLTRRNIDLMEALDGLAERFCLAVKGRERLALKERERLRAPSADLAPRDASVSGPWTCFHCGETFTVHGAARDHFGGEDAEPGCLIDRVSLETGGRERGRGLLMALRKAEERIAALNREVESVENDARLWHESEGERKRLQKGENTSWFMFLDSLEGERLVLAERVKELEAKSADLAPRQGDTCDVSLESCSVGTTGPCSEGTAGRASSAGNSTVSEADLAPQGPQEERES